MINYVNIPASENGCTKFNHTINSFCLPQKTLCDHTVKKGLLTECDDQWICKSCVADKQYKWPVPSEGKVMLQTNFKSPRNPGTSDAWGTFIDIDLYDENDNLVTSGFASLASQYVVGYSGKYGYQTIEIDFSLISIDCGYFKITTSNGDEVCTQMFRKETCKELVEIEGNYNKADCWNNYYDISDYGYIGSSNFAYSNKIYLKGSIKIDALNVGDTEVEESLKFSPSELIAPYMAKYITYKLLNAKSITIDNETWYDKGNVLSARDKSNMFLPVLLFSKSECGADGNNCSL